MSYGRRMSWVGLLCGACLIVPARAQTRLLTIPGDPQNPWFASSVSRVGDVNGDGYADLLVGHALDSTNGTNAGKVQVFSGKNQEVLYTFHGDAAQDYFGGSVSAAGDVNADGYPDFVVGAGRYIDFLQTGVGYARVFSGRDGSVLYTFSEGANEYFGATVSGAGDTDHDGFDDVLVGAWWGDGNGWTDAGRVYLYSGRTGALLFTYAGNQHLNYVGIALSGASDVNGDGFDDFIVGCGGEDVNGISVGAVRVFSGLDGSILHELLGQVANEDFGWSVASIGDVDDDGVADFAAGAPGEQDDFSQNGAVRVYSGKSGALLYALSGANGSALFGEAIAATDDVDGDGRPDFVVGAPLADVAGADFGTAYVCSGPNGAPLFQVSGTATDDGLGWIVGGPGDVNKDGLGDLILSVPGDDAAGPDAGKVIVVSGKSCPASWSSYGTGWPGTNGIPSFTSSADPVLCSEITLAIGNSRGAATAGAMFIGASEASISTSLGGKLLVAPPWLIQIVGLPAGGLSLPLEVICDTAYCGIELDLQCLEVDPGASKGIAFTPGLSMTLGG